MLLGGGGGGGGDARSRASVPDLALSGGRPDLAVLGAASPVQRVDYPNGVIAACLAVAVWHRWMCGEGKSAALTADEFAELLWAFCRNELAELERRLGPVWRSEVAKTLRALPAFTCTTVAHPGEIPVEVFELDPQLLSEVRNSNPAVAIPPPAPPAKRSSGRTELPLPPGKRAAASGEFALALVGSGGESSAKGLADADAEREPSASGALEVMRQARRAVEEMERLLETRHGRALGASAVTANTVAYLCQRREAATVRCILAHEARIRAVVERLIAEVVRPCCDADAEQEAARGLAEKAANLFGEMRNAVDWPFPEGGGR